MSLRTAHVKLALYEQQDGWVIHIDRDNHSGQQYARVQCGDLDTALRMALPYIACLAEPDPFADLIRPSAARGHLSDRAPEARPASRKGVGRTGSEGADAATTSPPRGTT